MYFLHSQDKHKNSRKPCPRRRNHVEADELAGWYAVLWVSHKEMLESHRDLPVPHRKTWNRFEESEILNVMIYVSNWNNKHQWALKNALRPDAPCIQSSDHRAPCSQRKKRWWDGLVVAGTTSFPFLSRCPLHSSSFADLTVSFDQMDSTWLKNCMYLQWQLDVLRSCVCNCVSE